jgi:2'-5' RNA ligase
MANLIRSFIAIPLTPEIHHNLAGFDKLYGLDSRASGLRPVKPANIHLTLKFLGEIERSQVDILKNCLDQVTENIVPFTASVRGLGAFPNWRNRPRVIWVGVVPAIPIQEIFKRVDAATAQVGFPSEARAFSPHLTLARVSSSYSTQPLDNLLHKLMTLTPEPDFGSLVVDKLILFKSVLFSEGPVYFILSSHPFSG